MPYRHPRGKAGQCRLCDTKFPDGTPFQRRYCDECNRAKLESHWEKTRAPRFQCTGCGEPVWKQGTRCRPCTRKPPKPVVQDHICLSCGVQWTRPTARGQVPKFCPPCRGRNGSRDKLRSLRKHVLARDAGICWLCGTATDALDHRLDDRGFFICGPSYPTLDHVLPLSRGGADTVENLRTAHFICNSLRQDKDASLWLTN